MLLDPLPLLMLQSLPINDGGRERCALSVGQFRPEKDHALQVRALAALRNLSGGPAAICADGADSGGCRYPSFDDVRLVVLGSCRNEDDRRVLASTRALAVELGVEERVEFVVNCSFDELKAWLGRASVGVHTMWNEHFGIGVVEMMVRVLGHEAPFLFLSREISSWTVLCFRRIQAGGVPNSSGGSERWWSTGQYELSWPTRLCDGAQCTCHSMVLIPVRLSPSGRPTCVTCKS